MSDGIGVRPPRGDVDRGTHTDLVGSLYHSPRKIEIKMGVHGSHLCGVITKTVMAFGENRNAVKISQLQCLLKILLGKSGSDPRDIGGGMKIKMGLPCWESIVYIHIPTHPFLWIDFLHYTITQEEKSTYPSNFLKSSRSRSGA